MPASDRAESACTRIRQRERRPIELRFTTYGILAALTKRFDRTLSVPKRTHRRSEREHPVLGTYRGERMQQAQQEAEAARARVERAKRDGDTEVVEAYLEATRSLERWRLASQGLFSTRDSARLTQRAYTLGEADLQTLLLARRQALDPSLAAEQARVEAWRWHYRLLIDAHLIWALEEG